MLYEVITEEQEEPNGYHKISKQERAVTRKLISQYSDKSSDTFTLADMIKMKNNDKDKKRN